MTPPLGEDSAAWRELGEAFGDNHRARLVEDEVNRLGSERLRQLYAGVGSLAYPPELMLKIALFEYLQGRTSPAQWHRDASEHSAVRWLGRGIQPSRSVWYVFRDRMERVIAQINEDLIRRAVEEGLAAPVEAAQDGTTVRSHASRHRAINQETLNKRKPQVRICFVFRTLS